MSIDLQDQVGKKTCSEAGCIKPAAAKGMCSWHYQLARRATLAACTVDGCANLEQAKGLCSKHYSRLNRRGDTGDEIGRGGRIEWPKILDRASEIVNGYDIKVTLRQLFYRLVMEELIPNKDAAYTTLSERTAQARREDGFPPLMEHGRRVRQYASWDSPVDALQYAIDSYRVDRTDGQDYLVFISVEKNALSNLLVDWFGDLGLPVLPLGGYGSETLERAVRDRVDLDGRPAVLIYAGDFDPTGLDIERAFIENTADCWHETRRVGLDEQQIFDWHLPVLEGKKTDVRAAGFIAAHPEIHRRSGFEAGVPVQVELDAVEPMALRSLYQDELDRWWSCDAYDAAREREAADRGQLAELVGQLDQGDDDA